MRVACGCVLFLLWTVVSCAQSATQKDTGTVDSDQFTESVAIETGQLSSLSTARQRKRRQNAVQPIDSNTYFVGLYVQKAALPGNYTRTLKVVAYRVARSTRRRNRRSLLFGPIRRPPFHHYTPKAQLSRPSPPQETIVITEHHYHKVYVPVHHKVLVPVEQKVYVPVHVSPKPTNPAPSTPIPPSPSTPTTPSPSAPQRNLTQTQEIFNVINSNPMLANNLKEEFLREFNNSILPTFGGYIDPAVIEAANRLVVVRETGITCMDVCSSNKGDVLGYGTIGICTPRFCQCDFNLGAYTKFDCYSDKVFDPITLSCKSPLEVFLCNDEEIQELERPAVPDVAPSGFLASAAPSSLGKFLGNQATASPTSPVMTQASIFSNDNEAASLTPALSAPVAASQQAQILPLQPSRLQSPNQVSSQQVLSSGGQNIQQILRSLQLNLQQNPSLSQFAISSLLPSTNSVGSVDKQRANEAAQIVVQSVASTSQPFQAAQQQQIVPPSASPATALNSLTQSGTLNEINRLSPNQVLQLAELLRALENIKQNSGTQRKTELRTFLTPTPSLGSSSIENHLSGPAQTIPNLLRTPHSFSTSQQQQFVTLNVSPRPILSSVQNQGASEPVQVAQNAVRRPQSFPTIQQQQFATPAPNVRAGVSSIEIHRANELAQFEQNSVHTTQYFPAVQQQHTVTPTANSKTVFTLLTQSGYLNEILQLSPNQKEQLDRLVRALARKNEHFGTLKEPEVHTGQILPGGYN